MKLTNTDFGIVTDFYGIRISLEEAVRRLGSLGIRDLEIPGWHWAARQDVPYDRTRHAARVANLRSLLCDLGMNVQQFHSQFSLAADTEPNRAAMAEMNFRTIDLAAELGAKALVIHIAGRHDCCRGVSDTAIFEANVKTLAAMAKHAEHTPVRLAIENLMSDVNRQGCRISELKELISAVGSGNVGICLDTGHANVDGLDVPEAIRECGPQLIATHIQETCRGNDLHVFPFTLRQGKSTMDWFRIFETFARIGYAFPLIGECANNSGELPLELADRYLKAQKMLIESVLRGEFEQKSAFSGANLEKKKAGC